MIDQEKDIQDAIDKGPSYGIGKLGRQGLLHLNGNMLCAVDVETTGDRAGIHDIVQVCVLPLDSNIKPLKLPGIVPFYMDIQPKRPENIDAKVYGKNKELICSAATRGMEAYKAADLFDEWFRKLNLAFDKRISPLAQNWPFDREFIIDWLGHESFKQYFDARYRDSMVAALFANDVAEFQQERHPHAKVNLTYLAKIYRVAHDRRHDSMADCVMTAEIYHQMLKGQMPITVSQKTP